MQTLYDRYIVSLTTYLGTKKTTYLGAASWIIEKIRR